MSDSEVRANVHRVIDERSESHLQDLCTLVAQPSISAHDEGVKECAQLLADMMKKRGIAAEVIPTPGQPVVYGELIEDPNAFTLLCYGHYDVQPTDPLDLWESPPFEPTLRDGRLYGRGTGDNKGQLIAHVFAASAWKEVAGRVPINLKFVFEGEEESGSPNLGHFVREHKDRLACDLVYISDGGLHPSGDPVISLGNRGVVGITMVAEGADRDNHSGNKGGVVPNPVWMLTHLLATMVDPEGNVLIDGFYDDVRPITEVETDLVARLPFDPVEFGQTMGVPRVEYSQQEYYQRIMLKPYFNISGISSGYVGPGSKTIIPATAECRIDVRMVADQRTADIVEKVKRHAAAVDPRVRVIAGGMGAMEPSRTAPDHPAVPAVARALEEVHGTPAHINASGGGSLPNAVWPGILGTSHIGAPYANADENNHSPNENLAVDCFHRGIHASAEVFWHLGQMAEDA